MDDRQVQDPGQAQDEIRRRRPGRSGGLWAGLFLVLVGGVLLLDQLGFPLPDYLFNWHVLLIVIGLFLALRHNFRGGAWLILIAIGGVYMIQDYYPNMELHRFIWPGVLILAGLMFILRPRRHWRDQWHHEWKDEWKQRWRDDWERKHHARYADTPHTGTFGTGTSNTSSSTTTNKGYSSEDYIDATSIFGGVHKKMVTKNFKGGDVVTIMGGTEIDLSQADFTGVVRLDVTQVMGGTKIIVPAHWEVRTEINAIFAGFEDKRQQPVVQNPDKMLIIDGNSIFGGIELKNF